MSMSESKLQCELCQMPVTSIIVLASTQLNCS
jgi:hypothetical protein